MKVKKKKMNTRSLTQKKNREKKKTYECQYMYKRVREKNKSKYGEN